MPEKSKAGTGPTVTLPLPRNPARCRRCPYTAIGFICWSADGTCLRTDEQKRDRLERRRGP